MKGKSNRGGLFRKLRVNISILTVTIVVILASITVMRNLLMDNMKVTGGYLVQNYSSSEETDLATFASILGIGVGYIEEGMQQNLSIEELEDGLYPYMNQMIEMYGGANVQMYGMVYGHQYLISNNPQITSMTDFRFADQEYYKGAIEANGEVYVSSAHTDPLTGLMVVTLAQTIAGDRKSVV